MTLRRQPIKRWNKIFDHLYRKFAIASFVTTSVLTVYCGFLTYDIVVMYRQGVREAARLAAIEAANKANEEANTT